MKKNLIIALAVLVIAAMAIPASAAQLIFSGELNAKYTHTFTDTEEWTFADAAGESYLDLNLKFHEGENIVAFLPLTIEGFITPPSISVGNWYAAFNSQPWSFWVSNNDDDNPYHFEPLGDPMGIVAVLDGEAVINAAGPILGAEFNIYAADLGTDVAEVVIVPDDPETGENEEETDSAKVELGNAFVGRATYQLPIDFTIGLVGAYTNGSQRAVLGDGEAEVEDDPDHLTLGLDVSGVIPGLGANLVVAAAGSWEKVGGFDFDGESAAYAYMVKVSDIIVGPVKAWASYTAVDLYFDRAYADDDDSIVAEYADCAAAEVEAEVSIPVGFPLSLTLGNGLWMEYPAVLDYDEVYAKLVGEPLEDLIATISGAYKFDLTDGSEDDNGWKVHGDVEYTVFGLTLNPYVDYKVGSYAETDDHVTDKDTIVGMTIEGSPIGGLTIEAGAEYTFEEMYLEADAYAAFVTEANPGFVKSAKTTVAGLVLYELDMVSQAEADDDPDLEQTSDFSWYAFAGTELGITDAVDAKLGILAKDSENGIAASASVDYRVSETLSAGLIYTYRQNGPAYPGGYAGWLPFNTSDSDHYVLAKVTSKIGESTLTIAYGDDGLEAADKSGVHKGKPWAYLENAPTTPMNWDLLSITVKVPF